MRNKCGTCACSINWCWLLVNFSAKHHNSFWPQWIIICWIESYSFAMTGKQRHEWVSTKWLLSNNLRHKAVVQLWHRFIYLFIHLKFHSSQPSWLSLCVSQKHFSCLHWFNCSNSDNLPLIQIKTGFDLNHDFNVSTVRALTLGLLGDSRSRQSNDQEQNLPITSFFPLCLAAR